MVDAALLTGVVRTWWIEAIGALLALVAGALALGSADAFQGAIALALLLAFVDRIRLRMDNRSLAEQVRRFQGRLRERGE